MKELEYIEKIEAIIAASAKNVEPKIMSALDRILSWLTSKG